ncbi:hypothetical protein [Burkholderia cenocepacia]|uniref:phosphoribosyltransferase-like protein n=1 Tax=Burkholderia cenocepacia TaxID=95486 RepID=UPI000F5C1218|nr:hypothetical protein [Burkholderia cenocepacia]
MRADQYVEVVLAKCEGLRDAGLWHQSLRPRAWLNNFDESDRPAAAVLLDHFVFFSSNAVDQMLLSSFRQMRDALIAVRGKQGALNALAGAVFTSVEGEEPNVTDSGNLFCRKLRQRAGLPDAQFMTPARALEQAQAGCLVIFLDDILGSGSQMVTTWKREYLGTAPCSFEQLEASRGSHSRALVLVATQDGLDRLRGDVPTLPVSAAHTIDGSDFVRQIPRSGLLPDIGDVQGSVRALLAKYADQLHVPPYMNTTASRSYGQRELGLLLAFEHSVPDVTLPIFWAEGGQRWTPLLRRT